MAKRFSDRPGQGRVGIQLLPVNASRRTSNSFTACFLAVDITERMLTKFSAPAALNRTASFIDLVVGATALDRNWDATVGFWR